MCVCVCMCVCVAIFSCQDSFETQWTVAHQARQFMGFPRQECWDGLAFPSAGDLPYPWIEPVPLLHCRQILYHWATRKTHILYIYTHTHTHTHTHTRMYLIYIYMRKKWQSTPVFLPGKSHELTSLVGYSPWGYKGPDTPEQLNKKKVCTTVLSITFLEILLKFFKKLRMVWHL